MTDYNYWSKFNADTAAAEIDSKEKVQDFKDDKEKANRKQAKEMEVKIINSKKSSEIMQAQDAVNLLKAKGGRARRNQPATEVVTEPISPELALSIDIANSFRDLSDNLMKLMTEVEDLEVFVEKKSRHYPGYVRSLSTLREIELFSESKAKTKLLVSKIDPSDEDYVKQTSEMLEELDEAHKFLHQRTARYLSLFSLSIEQYSVSADMSRLVLRHKISKFDGSVWVQRSLALSAMGNTYLGKLHLSSAVGGGQLIPGLEDSSLMAYVTDLEYQHALDYLSRSEEQRLLRELHHQLDCLLSSSSTKLKGNSDLTSFSQADLQTFLYDSVPSVSYSGGDIRLSGDSDAAAIVNHILSLIDAHFTPSQKSVKCSLDVLLARFNLLNNDLINEDCDLLTWLLIDLCLKLFYEAQTLYLESMFGSALTKYYLTLLLIGCCLHHVGECDSSGIVLINKYLNRMTVSCLINAAQCKVNKQEHRSCRGSASSRSRCGDSPGLSLASLTVNQLLGQSAGALCSWCDSICNGSSLVVKLKSAALFDQMEEFSRTLDVLKEMEQLLANGLSNDTTEDSDVMMFTEHHAITGSSEADLSFQLSQQYLVESSVTQPSNKLSVEKWQELVRLQRDTTLFKQSRMGY